MKTIHSNSLVIYVSLNSRSLNNEENVQVITRCVFMILKKHETTQQAFDSVPTTLKPKAGFFSTTVEGCCSRGGGIEAKERLSTS